MNRAHLYSFPICLSQQYFWIFSNSTHPENCYLEFFILDLNVSGYPYLRDSFWICLRQVMPLEAATASDWWCTERLCRRISDCSQPLHRVSQKMHRVSHSWPANQLIQSGSSSKFKPTIKKLESLTFDNNRPSSDQKSEVLPFCWKRGFFGFHFCPCAMHTAVKLTAAVLLLLHTFEEAPWVLTLWHSKGGDRGLLG